MKSLKKLLIPIIVMVALIIGVVVYYAVKNKEPEASVIENIDVLTVLPNEVKSVTVNSKLNQDVVVSVDNVYDSSTNSFTYSYNGSDKEAGVDYSQTDMQLYTSVLTSYVANQLVSSDGNFSEYGLDNPEYVVDIDTYTGEHYTVNIGDDTYDGKNCYFNVVGSNDIYSTVVAKKVYASYTLVDFLESQILNVDYSDLATVRFQRNTDGMNLLATCEVYDTSEPVYYVQEPFVIQASPYFENLMEYICTLEISKFVEIPDEEIASYGLDNPAYNFTLKMRSGEETSIHITRNLAGYYYGFIDGVDNYFMISEMQIQGLDTPILTLINSYIFYRTASEMNSISCTYPNGSFEFEMQVDPNTAITDDTSTVTIDGRNAKVSNSSGRSYCAMLYETLATIKIGGIDTQVSPAFTNPEVTITYITNNHQTMKYQFVQRSSDSYYVFLDGEYTCFFVYASELYKDAGADTYSYGVITAYELLDKALNENINGIYDMPA